MVSQPGDTDVSPETAQAVAGLLATFLAAVSFRAGSTPDYSPLRDVFLDGGLLIRASVELPIAVSVQDFISDREDAVRSGSLTSFAETELAGTTTGFGKVAHRLSVYSKRGTTDGHLVDTRGVISTQFVLTPAGWRISSMAWDDERDGLRLPGRQ